MHQNIRNTFKVNGGCSFCRAVERDTDPRRGHIKHPRHMGLSLKEQQKLKGKKKKKVTLNSLNIHGAILLVSIGTRQHQDGDESSGCLR